MNTENNFEDKYDTKERKLKIYFGYAAGVGKTYQMLQDAHDELKSGTDIMIGYIEPHKRDDTTRLIEGLPRVEPLKIEYKGATLYDFDLDEVLKIHPRIVLVDELAHTNSPGMRHKKRYQDVKELLRHGIDVYTTLY